MARAGSENVYKAIIAAARTLLVTFGIEPKKDRQILAAFSKHLIEPGWFKPEVQQLLNNALDWRMGDIESIEDLLEQVEDLVNRVEELFLSLDANLKFKAKPTVEKANVESNKTKNHIIDLRGIACPLNFVKAKLELEKLETGDILEVLLDEGEPVRNAPASFAEQGQEVIEVKNVGEVLKSRKSSVKTIGIEPVDSAVLSGSSSQSSQASGKYRQTDCCHIT